MTWTYDAILEDGKIVIELLKDKESYDKLEMLSKFWKKSKQKEKLQNWLKGYKTCKSEDEYTETVRRLCRQAEQVYTLWLKEREKKNDIKTDSQNKQQGINSTEIKIIPNEFLNPKLLSLIHQELSKRHFLDDYEKMTAFLVAITSFFKESSLRKSLALRGDSSIGKDNLIDTLYFHMPEGHAIKLTNATSSVLEDDITDINLIFFSEVNLMREGGANKHLIENLKQMQEGGSHVIKKDSETNYKTVKDVRQEQKTLIYSTTESANDEELNTRDITIGIQGYPTKTKEVVKKFLLKDSNPDRLIKDFEKKDYSWIREGLGILDRNILFFSPYSPVLTEYLDISKPRVQRDIKKLTSIAYALTWLHQKQRINIEHKGHRLLFVEPIDLLNAIKISGQFFSASYSGLEPRLKEVLELMKGLKGGKYFDDKQGNQQYSDSDNGQDINRRDIHERVSISLNTLKKRLSTLCDLGFIFYSGKEGHNIYYSVNNTGNLSNTCQIGIITCQIEDLIKKFQEFKIDSFGQPFDSLLTGLNLSKIELWTPELDLKEGTEIICQIPKEYGESSDSLEKQRKKEEKSDKLRISAEIDRSKLTGTNFREPSRDNPITSAEAEKIVDGGFS